VERQLGITLLVLSGLQLQVVQAVHLSPQQQMMFLLILVPDSQLQFKQLKQTVPVLLFLLHQ
jgi:hypothetical protein